MSDCRLSSLYAMPSFSVGHGNLQVLVEGLKMVQLENLLGGCFGYVFKCFFLLGGGKGESEAPGRGVSFLLKILAGGSPRRGVEGRARRVSAGILGEGEG